MAVYQPRRAAIAIILVAVMQDDIREELLVVWFFSFFSFSHFLAFSVTVVRIFVQIIVLLFLTGRWQTCGSHIALSPPWLPPLTEKLSCTIIRSVKRKKLS